MHWKSNLIKIFGWEGPKDIGGLNLRKVGIFMEIIVFLCVSNAQLNGHEKTSKLFPSSRGMESEPLKVWWSALAFQEMTWGSSGEVCMFIHWRSDEWIFTYIYTYIILIIVRITLRLDYKCIYANYFCKNSVCEGKCILWQIITGAFCVMACLPPRYSVPMLRIDSHWYHQAR